MSRLDRLLSNATGTSRSQVRRAIRAAEVTVNDRSVRDPACQVGSGDLVCWRGEPVIDLSPRYFMLHKPAGYECGRADPVHRSVFELLDEAHSERLHIVGRLDVDTTGLVLLTDDGDWSHRITAPGRKRAKSYRLELAEPWPAGHLALEKLRTGVRLRNEARPTAPAQVERLGPMELRLILMEGRYHQVKRMIAALGNRVVALHRERIGALTLDPGLPAGGYRALTEAERDLAVNGDP